MNVIKNAIPNFYNPLYMGNSGEIKSYKYLCKIKNNDISIISKGIGYWSVTCRIKIIRNNDSDTAIIGNFDKNILYKLISFLVTMIVSFCCMLYLFGELFMDTARPIRERIVYAIFAVIVALCFVTYYLYNKKTRYKEKKKILNLLSDLFKT